MGWLTSAAIREPKLLKKLLGLSAYQLDSNGNVTGFLDASGMPMKSKAVPWSEFLTLGSGDVADRSAVWVYDKQCMFVWNDLAARWYQVGGRLTFATFDLAPLPTANINGLQAWIESGIGIGGAWIEIRLIGSTYLWRYRSGRAVLKFRSSNISKTKATEEALEGFKLVRNNGKNIMQEQPAMNVSKGKFGRLVQAMYLPGVYFGGKANQDVTVKTAGFNLWDGYPGVLPPPAM